MLFIDIIKNKIALSTIAFVCYLFLCSTNSIASEYYLAGSFSLKIPQTKFFSLDKDLKSPADLLSNIESEIENLQKSLIFGKKFFAGFIVSELEILSEKKDDALDKDLSLMVNAYIFPLRMKKFSPYLGVGTGNIKNHFDLEKESRLRKILYHVNSQYLEIVKQSSLQKWILGLNMKFSSEIPISLFVDYRICVSEKNTEEIRQNNKMIVVGLRAM